VTIINNLKRMLLILIIPFYFLFYLFSEIKRACKNMSFLNFKKEIKYFWENPNKIV